MTDSLCPGVNQRSHGSTRHPRSVRDAISSCPLILSAVRLGVRDRILGDDGDLSLAAGAATDMSASVEHVRPGCSRGDSHFHGHADIGVDVSSGFKRLPELSCALRVDETQQRLRQLETSLLPHGLRHEKTPARRR